MVVPQDCSELFPHYDSADFVVIENSARIRLWSGGTHTHLDMNVDKIAAFLDRCRSQQDPRIHHLAPSQATHSLIREPRTLASIDAGRMGYPRSDELSG